MIPLVLAQVDPVKPIADGLGASFLPYALALCLVAIAYLFKLLWDQAQKNKAETAERERGHDAELKELQKSKDAEIKELNAALLAQANAHAGEIRKTLETMLPIQSQLAEMIHLTKE